MAGIYMVETGASKCFMQAAYVFSYLSPSFRCGRSAAIMQIILQACGAVDQTTET